ncbi:unnamed protein product [Sphagnum balticum]
MPKGRKIMHHVWYKRKMIAVATDKCEVYILEEARPNVFEIRQEYHNAFNETNSDHTMITAMCAFSKGLILGSSNGKFSLWTSKDDGYQGEESLELSSDRWLPLAATRIAQFAFGITKILDAHLLRFSKGGHLLACAYPIREEGPADNIKIFNALTLEEVVLLKDQLGSIRSLQFKSHDDALLAVGSDGGILEWRVSDWSKMRSLRRDLTYQAGIYWQGRNSIVTYGTKGGKSFIEEYGCDTGSFSQL